MTIYGDIIEIETIKNKNILTITTGRSEKLESLKGEKSDVKMKINDNRTLDQNRLMWKLYEIIARITYPEEISFSKIAWNMYNDDMKRYAPEIELMAKKSQFDELQSMYRLLYVYNEKNGHIYVKAKITSSWWGKKRFAKWIEYLYDRIAHLEVTNYEFELKNIWTEHKKKINKDKIQINTGPCNIEHYRKNNLYCESCGVFVGGSPPRGEVSHIRSRGSGGRDVYENLLRLCNDCHIHVQHQKGWEEMKKLYPWISWKVDTALMTR